MGGGSGELVSHRPPPTGGPLKGCEGPAIISIMRRCRTSQLTSDLIGDTGTEAPASHASHSGYAAMQPSLVSERFGRYLSVKMTERNPAVVAAQQTETELKMEKTSRMEGGKDWLDCWLSVVAKTKKKSV